VLERNVPVERLQFAVERLPFPTTHLPEKADSSVILRIALINRKF
jgi:hypothetical protein